MTGALMELARIALRLLAYVAAFNIAGTLFSLRERAK